MTTKRRPSTDPLEQLIGQPHFGQSRDPMPSTDPISPTPMVIATNEIDTYDRNPRQQENEKYEDIKASILAVGLDQTLTVTRRPGEKRYMIAAGGNTRLQAIKALLDETGEERFRTIHCLYKPWVGDTDTLVAHLKENDVRGDLGFIDRARGLMALKALADVDQGKTLSLRQFSGFLADSGYSISPALLTWCRYAVESLEAAIPLALQAGMGRPQIERIRKLHKGFLTAWTFMGISDTDVGSSLFIELLSRQDDDVIDLDLLHRNAVNELSVSADCDVQHAAMIYGAAIEGRDLDWLKDNRGEAVELETPLAGNASTTTHSPQPSRPPPDGESKVSSVGKEAGEGATGASQKKRNSSAQTAPETVVALRRKACVLAEEAAQMLGCDQIITAIDSGLGFLVAEVPKAVSESIPESRHRELYGAWSLLVSISEQYATHGLAEEVLPAQWKQAEGSGALHEVPFMLPNDYAAVGLHRVSSEFFDTWTTLVSTTRRIHEATDGQPWA